MRKLQLYSLYLCALASLALLPGKAMGIELVVNASVPQQSPQLTATILKITDGDPDANPWTNSSTEDTIDFGELTYLLKDNTNAGAFFSNVSYCVILFVEPYGRPFNIQASCAGITDAGGHSLPVGSFGMIPVYSRTDKWKYQGGEVEQGDMPSGATLGNPGPAVPGGTVYSSESGTATARILQLYFSIPPYKTGGGLPYPGYVPVPLTQAPGRYSTTVTLTLSSK